ncbi:MAG: PKD domain-containing protein [Planctomycetota bacterium]
MPSRLPAVRRLLPFVAFLAPAPLMAAGEAEDPLGALVPEEIRANTWTEGAQEDPGVAVDAEGRILVTWSSRRQEQGGYGVFAQLLDPLGRPLGPELHVNSTRPGAQQDAGAVFAPGGGAWVAWSSLDRRAADNGIFLRRLAGEGARFGPAGEEIRVAGARDALLTDPALAVNAAGELFMAWVENDARGLRVWGARLAADGTGGEPTFRLDETTGGEERMPDIAALPDGGFFVVWPRAAAGARPRGIFGRRFGSDGAAGEVLLLSDRPDLAHVEPRLAARADGELLVAWMAAAPGSAAYEVRARRFSAAGEPRGGSFVVEAGGRGHRNGAAAAAAPNGDFLVAYNAVGAPYVDEEGRTARDVGVYARLYGAEGAPHGPGKRLSAAGPRCAELPVAVGGRPAGWSPAGVLAVAWSGDAPGDRGGVGVHVLAPAGLDVPAPPPVVAVAADPGRADAEWEAPPDPLPPAAQALRPVPDPEAPADGFIAHDQTGWTPPDPDLAVGPDRIVSQANMETACFDKNGVEMWRRINTGASGFWGALGAEGFVFDPVSVYDVHSGRFVIANSELASDGDYVVLAVSKDPTPDTWEDWWKYRVKVSPTCGFPDFPNLGVNRDHIYVTTDCFSGGGNRVVVFEKASVANGVLGTWWNEQMHSGLQSLGNTKNYDSGNAFQYFVAAWGSNMLRIQCKQTPAAAPDSAYVGVTGWTPPPGAPQQGTSNLLSTIDARIKSGVVRNGRLYCAHGAGHYGTTKVKWYEIDLQGWPASGNQPVLVQEGRLDLGPGVFSWFPDVHVDAAGDITIAYNRSAAAELPSIEAVFRRAGDCPSTMRPPKRLKSSPTNYTGSRYGDYSGVDQDPAQPERFWSHAEYSRGPWETWIGWWDVNDEPDPYAQFTAAPTEGDEDLAVAFTDWSVGTALSSWSWDFGDGGFAAEANPVHVYADPGTYTVSLLVGGASGLDLRTKVDLVVVHNVPEARAEVRNGSGINPLIFASTSVPYLGTVWTSEIDVGAVGGSGLTFVVGYQGPISGIFLSVGELLIDPTSAWIVTSLSAGAGGTSHHSIGVPNDPALAGFMFSTQGFLNNVAGSGSGRLTNAIDLELAY